MGPGEALRSRGGPLSDVGAVERSHRLSGRRPLPVGLGAVERQNLGLQEPRESEYKLIFLYLQNLSLAVPVPAD
jgi:hypothetical protein